MNGERNALVLSRGTIISNYVNETGEYPSIQIVEPCKLTENYFIPAQSIWVGDEDDIRKLRDFLDNTLSICAKQREQRK